MLTNKRCGVDLAILVDLTHNMQNGLPAVKRWCQSLFDRFFNGAKEEGELYIQNWRAKIVGYRNIESDYEWIVNNPFTTDVANIMAQLNSIEANLKPSGNSSLLDAFLTVGGMETVPNGASADEWQWRNNYDNIHVILVFTNSPYDSRILRTDLGCLTWEDVVRLLTYKRVILVIITSAEPFDKSVSQDDFVMCYKELVMIDGADHIPLRMPNGLPMDIAEIEKWDSLISAYLLKETILRHCLIPR